MILVLGFMLLVMPVPFARLQDDETIYFVMNGHKKPKQLSKLYRTRRKRFRHAIATFARQLARDIYARGVSSIVIGELTGIRSNSNHGKQGNAMVLVASICLARRCMTVKFDLRALRESIVASTIMAIALVALQARFGYASYNALP